MNWRFIDTCLDGDRYEIFGRNIWDYEWTFKGEYATVIGPIHKQELSFKVFEIEDASTIIEFAAGELSNGVWGFYLKSTEVEFQRELF